LESAISQASKGSSGVLNNFDYIAPVYDRLASLVYGKAIKDAQRVHLPSLITARSILIVGGGTGWLLKDVLELNPDSRITYLEASAKMLALSRKGIQDVDAKRVTFIHGTEVILSQSAQFDTIIANFYLDLFTPAELSGVIIRLKHTLLADGQLVCTDFVNHTVWQRMLLGVMYGFFRLTTGLQNQQLAPWRDEVEAQGFQRVQSRSFWNAFIYSELFRLR
jgi:ubiquinone/menaquinone biosynthesis C-methylase UbiE